MEVDKCRKVEFCKTSEAFNRGNHSLGVCILITSLMTAGGCVSAQQSPALKGIGEKVFAHGPLEVSGVAILEHTGEYAVVGDGTSKYGRTWPSGKGWRIKPKVKDPESVDVEFDKDGSELWLIAGEDDRIVAERGSRKARLELEPSFREVCGRGLEGLSVKNEEGTQKVAALWEGGYYDTEDCEGKADKKLQRNTPLAIPKIVFFDWEKGVGGINVADSVELDVPIPLSGRFRATDIAWLGNDLVVLLGSTGEEGSAPFDHTWLQRFNQSGERVGEPIMLEEEWGNFRDGKNWEALDISRDGSSFVMGYDDSNQSSELVIFPNPF